MKSKELTLNISRSFLPYVTLNGYIIFQDFAHFYTSWIHILIFNIKEKLTPIQHIKDSGSFVFQLNETLVQNDFSCISESENYTRSRIDEIFNYSLSLSNKEDKGKIIAAKAMWYVHKSMFDEALKILNHELPKRFKTDIDVKETYKIIENIKNQA